MYDYKPQENIEDIHGTFYTYPTFLPHRDLEMSHRLCQDRPSKDLVLVTSLNSKIQALPDSGGKLSDALLRNSKLFTEVPKT
jgi:hypothetical protein